MGPKLDFEISYQKFIGHILCVSNTYPITYCLTSKFGNVKVQKIKTL